MTFTRFRTGAMLPCLLLFLIAVLLILRGDTCAAVGIVGVIGVVASRFADKSEDAIRSRRADDVAKR